MEAAKRMFDNSYNQRLETAALAKAYLDNAVAEANKKEAEEEAVIKNNAGRFCSAIGVISSMVYCFIIFGLLLMPLVKETELHRMQIANANLNIQLTNLQKKLDDTKKDIAEKANLVDYEQYAIDVLGFVERDETMRIRSKVNTQISLETARNAYYHTSVDFTSLGSLD